MSKATISAMAESTIQSITNTELVELQRRKKAKASRLQGNYGGARVMNQCIVDERKARYIATAQQKESKKKEKEWDQEIKRLRILGPDLFTPPRPPATPRRRAPAPPTSPPATLICPNSPPARRQKKIVTLRLRVTTADLQQGRWKAQGEDE